ncbi:MAG: hypothetical protein Q8N16_01890 [bacterium]|nr:hypothetical protein [bacterium]
MTKYILHGGYTKEINRDNDSFFTEITADAKNGAQILLCYFARKSEETPRALSKRQKQNN